MINIKDLKYIGKSLEAVRNFDTESRAILDKYQKRMEGIKNLYVKSAPQYQEATLQAQQERAAAMRTARQKWLEAHVVNFNAVKSKVDDLVSTPMPDDIEKNVKYLNEHGKDLSREEIRIILEKCSGNYQAMRNLAKWIPKIVNGSENHVVQYDEFLDYYKDLDRRCINFFTINAVNVPHYGGGLNNHGNYNNELLFFGGLHEGFDKVIGNFLGDTITMKKNIIESI